MVGMEQPSDLGLRREAFAFHPHGQHEVGQALVA
jgi:hypothetical protein